MADKIHASSEWLEQCARQLSGINSAIAGAASALSSIHLRRDEGGSLKTSLSLRFTINGRSFSGSTAADDIRQLQAAASSLSQAAGHLSGGASRAASLFSQAEDTAVRTLTALSGTTGADTYQDGTPFGGGSGGGGFRGAEDKTADDGSTGGGTSDGRSASWSVTTDPRAFWRLIGPIMGPSWIAKDFLGFLADPNLDLISGKGGSLFKKKVDRDPINPRYDKDGNEIKYNGPKFGHTIAQAGIEKKDEASLLRFDGHLQNGNDTIDASMAFGTVAYTAGVYGGLYTVKYDKDGTAHQVLSPGVKAEIGASVSALEFTLSGHKDDGIPRNVEIGGKIGYASADAKAEVGFVDGKAVFHGSASAEAIAAEISARGNIEIGEAKVGVKGTLNYGIGAHADIGYKDGKFSCDIGASVGVGGSIALEVDVGAYVDKAVNVGKEVVKGVRAIKGLAESAMKMLW